MAQRVCIIGGGVIGLATAYALVRDGFEVSVIEAQPTLGSQTSFANGGQLSYRYVAPLARCRGALAGDGLDAARRLALKLRPRMDPAQWRWLASFMAACRSSVNQRNGAHLLRLALLSQATLQQWREEDQLDGFAWQRNGKLVAFREHANFDERAKSCRQCISASAVSQRMRQPGPGLQGSAFVGGIYTPAKKSVIATRSASNWSPACRPVAAALLCWVKPSPVCAMPTVQYRLWKWATRCWRSISWCSLPGTTARPLRLPGMNLPLYPLKGYSLTLALSDPQKAPQVSITDYDRKIVYARIGEQLRIAAMVDIVGFDPSLDWRLAQMRQLASSTFSAAGNYDNATEWAGMRPATPSGVPIPWRQRHRNLWLNLGHGALGFTLACGSGACSAG